MAKREQALRKARAARKPAKPTVDLKRENAALRRELTQALDRQAATSDVLNVISRSSADLETVLDRLVVKVTRLCHAGSGHMLRRRGDSYHLVAACGLSERAKTFILAHPIPSDRGSVTGRVALDRRAVHIPDVLQDREYTYREANKITGTRTILGIPLLREETLLGIFIVSRKRVDPFTGKDIELVTSFADQAVIAIENARLFEELRERQTELRVTLDNMGDGVAMFGADLRLAAWNRNFQEILDLPDAFLAKRPSHIEYFRYLADRGEFSADLAVELSRFINATSLDIRFERTRPDGRVIEVRRNPVPGGGFVHMYSDVTERKRAVEALRASEALLTEAQQLTHTGSCRWKVRTNEVVASAELLRIFAFDPGTQPSVGDFLERVHPEDLPLTEQVLARAAREGEWFQYEYRLVRPDGSIRHLQAVGKPDNTASGEIEFIGTVMDITERRRAEEALRSAQVELARVARLTTMGELVASIAHEINQPLAAVVTNGSACLNWLGREKPDIDEARKAASAIVRDAKRAGGVIRGLRALAAKSEAQLAEFDVNDAIREVLALTRTELQRHGVVLHTDLSADERWIFGDRVQLQQVLLNLIMNGVEAMNAVTERPKVLTITSQTNELEYLRVAVEDTGTGLDPATADRIFDPFFTTKPNGMGMGLSICRSLIETHGGRLWASQRLPHGAIFQFTVLRSAQGSRSVGNVQQ
jgi:signal transduction histidine kinase/GAF domain-containing protein